MDQLGGGDVPKLHNESGLQIHSPQNEAVPAKLKFQGQALVDSFDDIGNIDALPPLRSHRLETSHPITQVSPKQKGSKKEILNRGLAQETSIGIRATEETSYPMGSPELGMRTAPTLNQLGPEPAQSKGILFGAKKPISPPTKPSDKEAQVQVRINNLVKAPGQNGSSNPKRVFLAIDTEEATVLAAEKMKGDETSHAESAPRLVLERSESNTRLNPPNEMPVEERKMFWASVLARSPNPTPTNRIVPQIRLLGIEGSLGGGQSQDIKKDQSPKKNESPRQPDSNRLKMLAGFLLSKAGSKDPEMGGKTAQTMKFKFPGLKGVMSAAKRMLQTGKRSKMKHRVKSNVFRAIDTEKEPQSKYFLSIFLQSTFFQVVLLLFTFYSLAFDDYQSLTCTKATDTMFDGVSLFGMAIFFLEIMLSSLYINLYFNSYYFYLDSISMLSMLIDLNMVKDAMNTSLSGTGSSGVAKLGKLVRLVRLIKLFRISRIYKSFSKESKPKDGGTPDTKYKPKDGGSSKKDSRVGAKLSEMATKTVILLVFILLILLPLFDADFWTNTSSEGDILCQQLLFLITTSSSGFSVSQLQSLKYSDTDAMFSSDSDSLQSLMAFTVKENVPDIASRSLGPIVRITLGDGSNSYYGGGEEYTSLRYEEMNYSTCGDNNLVQVYQQDTSESSLESALGLGRTLYICALLLGGAGFFSRSAQDLVIRPIERMIDKVINVIENPQKVKEEAFVAQEEKEFKQFLDKFDNPQQSLAAISGASANGEDMKLETAFLEEAIDKICVLLGVGLGEAGTELINSYLNRETDLMNIASQTDAVFAFCDIRNFTDATEILQEEVMMFVNTIAEIVHSQADETLGAANKNVGDAFLIVWRVTSDDSLDIDVKGIEQDIVNTNLCELAFYSVLTMIAEIGRAFELKRFADNPMMKERIGDNYKVRLGFGMHFGWAIEGALGSQFKVDVTYLSPHVNMAVRLEGETKKYGTGLLMTGEFVDKLSHGVRVYCRQIDIFENSDGSILRLYTALISEKSLKYPTIRGIDNYRMRTKERSIVKKVLRNDLISGNLVGRRLFQNDKNIALLITGVHPKLSSTFFEGFQFFKRGDFSAAKVKFEEVLKMDNDDGPTLFLLQLMEKYGSVKPPNWNGIRKLEDIGGH